MTVSMVKHKVIIYPTFDAFYYSFYIQGLFEVFGKSEIEFSSREFPPFHSNVLAFIVKGSSDLRIVIDAYDGAAINSSVRTAAEWCDIYGKVNLVPTELPKAITYKFVPIGPSFPIRVWTFAKSWQLAVRNYRPAAGEYSSTCEHFANYRRQYKYRLPLTSFVPGTAREGYIFYASSIWDEEAAPNTNQYRARFIDSCRSSDGVVFEGGFCPPGSSIYADRYKNYIAAKWFPLTEWLQKIQLSTVAFYTPGVWLSHTFKLAEFLALGKAIIATPVSRALPAPLVHGRHVHYVDGSSESIKNALQRILRDRAYRKHLEQNASTYFRTFLTPTLVIQRLLSCGQQGKLLLGSTDDVIKDTGEQKFTGQIFSSP